MGINEVQSKVGKVVSRCLKKYVPSALIDPPPPVLTTYRNRATGRGQPAAVPGLTRQ